jgi:gluconate 5-dehydrogenase
MPKLKIVMASRQQAAGIHRRASLVAGNGLAPCHFSTSLTRALVNDTAFSTWSAARTPAGRWGDVDELVRTLTCLSFPASNFANWRAVHVDGGMTAVV